MPEMNDQEYAIVMKALLDVDRVVKSGTELSKMVTEAIQTLKQASKRKPASSPEGASYKFLKSNLNYTSDKARRERIKGLMQMFGVTPR